MTRKKVYNKKNIGQIKIWTRDDVVSLYMTGFMYGTRATNTFESPGITGRSVDVCLDQYFLHLYLSDFVFHC